MPSAGGRTVFANEGGRSNPWRYAVAVWCVVFLVPHVYWTARRQGGVAAVAHPPEGGHETRPGREVEGDQLRHRRR